MTEEPPRPARRRRLPAAAILIALTAVACGGSKSPGSEPTPVTTSTSAAPTTTSTIPLSLYARVDSMTADLFAGMGVEADNPSYFTPAEQESDCNLLIKQVELMVRMLPTTRTRLGNAWAAMLEALQRTYLACKARPRSFTASDWSIVKQDLDRYRAARDEFVAAFTAS